jgi:hypothetical protein
MKAVQKLSSTRARRPAARPLKAPTKGHAIPRATWRGKPQDENFGYGVLTAMRMLLWTQDSTHRRSELYAAEAIEAMMHATAQQPAKYQEGFRAALARWLAYSRENDPDAARWTPFRTRPTERKDGSLPVPSSHLLFEHLGRPISVGPGLDCAVWDRDGCSALPWETAGEYLKMVPISRKRFNELRRAQS